MSTSVKTPAEKNRAHRFTLKSWNPEDEKSWDSKLAWTTLGVSTYSMILAFCVWFLVSAIAPKLNSIGFDLSKSQLYILASMPGLSCGFLRLIYTFLPPIIGTRKLVGISSLLYIFPMVGWFFAVQNPATPFWWMLCLAFMCGIGGGSFSGYMPSTGYFFPKRLQGTALGIQAGIGNLGMSVIQFTAPVLMGSALFGITFLAPAHPAGAEHPLYLFNVAIFFAPWALLAAILSFIFLRDVPIKANFRQQLDVFSNANTWYMMVLYVMTFGLFAGFSAVFGLLINNSFGANSSIKLAVAGTSFAFLGPMIGSLVRMAWGPMCDKFGGAIWTFVCGVGMAVCLLGAAFFVSNPSGMGDFYGFLAFMLVMFFFTGLGNAGTFKQMPMIMPARQAGGAIGFTAAIASFGPFIVSIALTKFSPTTWFIVCAIFCIVGSVICWVRYARPKAPFPG